MTRGWTRTIPRTPRRHRYSPTTRQGGGPAPTGGRRRSARTAPERGVPARHRTDLGGLLLRYSPSLSLLLPPLTEPSPSSGSLACPRPGGNPASQAAERRRFGQSWDEQAPPRAKDEHWAFPKHPPPSAPEGPQPVGKRHGPCTTCFITWEAPGETDRLHTVTFQKPKAKETCRCTASSFHPCQTSRSHRLSSSPGVL